MEDDLTQDEIEQLTAPGMDSYLGGPTSEQQADLDRLKTAGEKYTQRQPKCTNHQGFKAVSTEEFLGQVDRDNKTFSRDYC